MTPDLDQLETLAKAVGGDQWTPTYATRTDLAAVWLPDGDLICRCHGNIGHWPDPINADDVAEFIAAANPATMLALIAEVRALRDVCAAAYQLAGTMNAPVRFLDALSDASNGETEARAKTDDLLPVSPDEVGSFLSDEGQEYREDAERYRFARESIQEGYAFPGGFYLSESGGESWDNTIDAARKEPT